MPRNSNGIFTLVSGNPVISGSIITSDWANTTMPDIGNELTNSLSRDGEGGMLAALRHVDGSSSQPSISFTNEIGTGFYRAGTNDIRFNMATFDIMRFVLPNQGGVWINNQLTGLGLERVLTTSDITAGGANEFPGPNPTLDDAVAALIIGTTDPDTAPHIAMGPDVIQAKADATTNADLHINRWGGAVHIWQDNDFRKALFDGPYVWLFGQGGAGTTGQNGIFFEGDNFGSGNNHIGYIGDPTEFKIQNWRGGSIWLNAGSFNGRTEVKPSLRGEIDQTGFLTPMINCESNEPATPTSIRHGLQVGTGPTAVRVGNGTISTSSTGSLSVLKIQEENGTATIIGNTTGLGCAIKVDSTNDLISLYHLGTVIAESETPANGGLLVNGLYGSERVLTLGDLGQVPFVPTQLTENASVLTVIPSLTFVLQPNQIYRVNGLLKVQGNGAGCFVQLQDTLAASEFSGTMTYMDDASIMQGAGFTDDLIFFTYPPSGNWRHVFINGIITVGVNTASWQTSFSRAGVTGTALIGVGSTLEVTKLS